MRQLLIGTLLLLLAGLASAAAITDTQLLALLAKTPTAQDYPNAPAVCLLREMTITVDANGGTVVRDHRLITILNPAGLALAQWAIPYDKSCETVEVSLARTLVNGQAYALDPTQVVESAVYPGMAWYDALTVRRFPLPGAVVGATLEVETVFHRPLPRIPGEFSARLPQQMTYPVREMRTAIRLPAAMPLTVRFVGMPAPAQASTTEGDARVIRWTLTDVPAFRVTESQTPPSNDLLPSARLCTLTSWEPVAAWYRRLTDGKDSLTPALEKLARERAADCATVDAKIAVLHKLVRELPYIAMELGTLSDVPHSPAEVVEHQYGDCKDKATLLRALLKAVGIDSDYVLVRTTERGALDRACCGPNEFNHVILAVKTADGDRFLDATLADASPDLLPPGVEGAEGLIIRGAGELVTLPVSDAARNRTEVTVVTAVKADGSATGRLVMRFRGQSALLQRGALAQVPDERYQEALEQTLAARLGGEAAIESVKVEHLHEPELPLALTAEFTIPKYLQPAGDGLSAGLPLFMFQPNRYRSIKERALPFLQSTASSLHEEAIITLPDGVTITRLPATGAYEGPVGSYHDVLTQDGQTLHYTCDYALARGVFPPAMLDDYKTLAALLALEGRNGLQFFVKKP